MTNFEKFKSMTVEELATQIKYEAYHPCSFCTHNRKSWTKCDVTDKGCIKYIVEWLNQQPK